MTALTSRLGGLRRRGLGGGRSQRGAYLYLVPAFAVMGVVTIYPLLFQVWMSFTDMAPVNLNLRTGIPPNVVGVDNYVDIVRSQLAIPNYNFLRLIIYNVFWAVSNVAIHLVIGVAIALLLNVKGLKFRRVYRALYILPVVIPSIIVATVWRNMFDRDDGAVNLLLAGFGGFLGISPEVFKVDWLRQVASPVDWLLPSFEGGPNLSLPLAFYAMLVTNTWLGWPLNSVVATGALQSVPKELYEAAEIDGASAWAKFRHVTMAYLRPAMLPYAIYGFVLTFNLFSLAYWMSGGGPEGRTELLVTQAYGLANVQRLYGVAAAFAVIMFFILLSITLVTNRLTKATQTYNL
ncbi:MAG TPA: sugar ABC transporter permease [Candidatus Sulfomarinibacteraceae bacterium]|nr:sugar ABC transporter permease [Candidatus Sulfomarinibacteraceae bacterium]